MTLSPVLIFFCAAHSPNAFHSLLFSSSSIVVTIPFLFRAFFLLRRLCAFTAIYTFLSMVLLSSTFISRSAYVFASYSLLLLFASIHLSSVYSASLLGFVANLLTYCVFAFVFRKTNRNEEKKYNLFNCISNSTDQTHTQIRHSGALAFASNAEPVEMDLQYYCFVCVCESALVLHRMVRLLTLRSTHSLS